MADGLPRRYLTEREPGYSPLSDKVLKKPKAIRDLITQRHVSQRGEIGSTSGSIELAYLRGYQGGYEDAAAGKPPEHYANVDVSERKKRKKS